MKRVKSACILQTLVFSQKDYTALTRERALKFNLEEVEKYKASMERSRTKYQIVSQEEQPDGSVIVHVKKQYSSSADVSEYFD